MGLTILKAAFTAEVEAASHEGNYARKILDALTDNYLCNVSIQEFHERCEPLLPEQMHGEEFLEKYGEIVDTATQVASERIYPVKSRVEHMIYENARTQQFITAIKNAGKDPDHIQNYLSEAGNLMYESNTSYRDLAGLGAPEVDGLVDIARKIGEQGGIYGAKITGGGGGRHRCLALSRQC